MSKKSKKKLTQKQLDKMSPPEVMAIGLSQLPDGYDLEHDNGSNPKLVKLDEAESPKEPMDKTEKALQHAKDLGIESEALDEIEQEHKAYKAATKPFRDARDKEVAEATEEASSVKYKDYPENTQENKGILFLRYFSKDESGKILTRLKGKVYFPLDPTIEPGWYIACVIEEHSRHGVMDTVELEDISEHLWNSDHIKGTHIKKNYRDGTMEIHPSIPRYKLDKEKSICIHKVPLSEKIKPSGFQIKDIIKQKEIEILKGIK